MSGKSVHELRSQVGEHSPFAGARLGEFAVGYGMDEEAIERHLPANESQASYLGRKFPVIHYPKLGMSSASVLALRDMFPDIPQDSSTGTIMFHDEQGELIIPHGQNHSNPTTTEG